MTEETKATDGAPAGVSDSTQLLDSRRLKCLKRINNNKSIHDMEAWDFLAEHGYIKISGPTDDMCISITPKGVMALESNYISAPENV